ncbi:hypothetical protein MBLNU459_g8104t2 [Dothideomycetes sp. NU459]
MAQIQIKQETLAKLNGKVVLITGGANGIGKTASKLFHSYGAKVVVADLDVASGKALAQQFGESGMFQAADVTKWNSLVELFEAAFQRFGSIDCVCANAGIPEKGDFLLSDVVDEDGKLVEPDFKIIDINVNGVMRRMLELTFLSDKAGVTLLRKESVTGRLLSDHRYFGAAPITKYAVAKHAVLGLVRSVAATLGKSNRLPETEFSSEVRQIWGDMPINSQEEVGMALLVACADETLHGRGLFVAKQIVDVEYPLHRLQAEWLGPEVSALFDKGAVRLASGMGLPTEHYLD